MIVSRRKGATFSRSIKQLSPLEQNHPTISFQFTLQEHTGTVSSFDQRFDSKNIFGHRSVSVATPKIWNKLPLKNRTKPGSRLVDPVITARSKLHTPEAI